MRNGKLIAAVVSVASIMVVLASVAWASTSRPTSQASPPSVPTSTTDELKRTGTRALFVGDSWIDGSREGGQGERNWSRLVARQFDWQYRGLGIAGSGYVVGGKAGNKFGSSERVSRIVGLQPDVLIVANGINDVLDTGGAPFSARLSQIGEAASNLYGQLRKDLPQTVIVAIGYIPPGDTTTAFVQANGVLAAAATKARVRFVDPTSRENNWFSGDPGSGYIGSDRYHPTDAGNVYLAGKIDEVLNQMRARDWPQVYTSNLVQSSLPPKSNPFVSQS